MADKKISALTSASTPLAGTEVLPIVQSGATVKATVENVFNTTQPSGTANGVVFLNSSKRATSGTAFTFDGSNLAYLNGSTFGLFRVTGDASSVAGFDMGTVASPDACRMRYSNATSSWTLRANAADAITVDSTQNVQVLSGNVVISTSGKGIDFSATSGSGTSELLADYEEGTFTPVISGDSGAGTGTYTSQTGYYTKIGRQVTVEIVLSWTAHTGVGDILVAGLPFTCNTASQSAATMLAYNLSLTASNYLVGRVRANSTLIDVLQSPTGGGAWNPVPIDTNVDAFVVTATYFV
jgi:hypothetical protein